MCITDSQNQWDEDTSKRYLDPEDIDHPSPLLDQLNWLEQAGFIGIGVHFIKAGHAVFSGWKPAEEW
jgi:hypothetical protein